MYFQKEEKEKIPKEGKDKSKAEMPSVPGLFISSSLTDCAMLSLDGLLDYNENDKQETTLEVSLFAEMFQNMLQREHAHRILQALIEAEPSKQENKRRRSSSQDSESKRVKVSQEPQEQETKEPQEQEEKEPQEQEQEAKEPKEPLESSDAVEGLPTDILPDAQPPVFVPAEEPTVSTEDINMTESSESQPPANHSHTQVDNEPEKQQKKQTVVDKQLLEAFHFFDRNQTGYLKSEDLETIIHCLGRFYSRYYVRHLVFGVSEHSKVFYKKLVEKEVYVE